MPTCDFCHLDKPKGKRYVKYTTFIDAEHATNLEAVRISSRSYTNLARHDFFVCRRCTAKRWGIVLGVLAIPTLIMAWFMGLGSGENPIKAGIWTFAISFFLLFILFGPLFLNFGKRFTARLKKGNPYMEVYSEKDYRDMTKING